MGMRKEVVSDAIRTTHRAFDGQVFTAIDRRADSNEVFVPRLCAQGLQGYASE